MENQIKLLNEDIQIGKQSNIQDIVKVVVEILEKSKDSYIPFEAMTDEETVIYCDQCEFRCKNENHMIKHISQKHEMCPSCDLCARYFGTQELLKKHNMEVHCEKDSENESDGKDTVQKESAEENMNQKGRKKFKIF